MVFRIRRLEIEDDKCADRGIIFSLYNIEAIQGLSKGLEFISQKQGGKEDTLMRVAKYLADDFAILSKELENAIIKTMEGRSKKDDRER